MTEIVLMAAAITTVGGLITVLVPVVERYVRRRAPQYVELGDKPTDPISSSDGVIPSAKKILKVFAVIVGVLGLLTLIQYWNQIVANADKLYVSAWLFLFMVAGMFVQVISANYRSGKPLTAVTGSQMVFPIMFSVIVFYPIWAITASTSFSFFSVHAAFLNGYFWESVVTNAQPQSTPPTSNAQVSSAQAHEQLGMGD